MRQQNQSEKSCLTSLLCQGISSSKTKKLNQAHYHRWPSYIVRFNKYVNVSLITFFFLTCCYYCQHFSSFVLLFTSSTQSWSDTAKRCLQNSCMNSEQLLGSTAFVPLVVHEYSREHVFICTNGWGVAVPARICSHANRDIPVGSRVFANSPLTACYSLAKKVLGIQSEIRNNTT